MGNTELRLIECVECGDLEYYVSINGDVYRKLKNKPRLSQLENKNSHFVEFKNFWLRKLKPRINHKGYLVLEVNSVAISVHRLVALTFIPNPEQKPQVNHKDGVKTNNHVSNLEWNTNQENVLHAFRVLGNKASGGRTKGVENKKTSELYDKIQNLLETTYLSKKDIADMFNVSYGIVKRVHSIRKVQRLSDYDFRKTRSLGVGNSIPEAQDISEMK